MVFRTEINLNKSTLILNYNSNILMIGSCFSENIGKKLENLHFNANINPFGTIYNVVSIYNVLHQAALKKLITVEELDYNANVYSHSDFHSSFNNSDPNATVRNINSTIERLHDQLVNIDITYITLGTSWVYKRKDKNEIAANCHKRPQHFFEKDLLTLDETLESLTKIVDTLHAINPHNQIVLTISPVRHIKDGIVYNQVSKAILLQAAYTLSQVGVVHYFPSYEMMMDDLRDYRFYKADLIHPSDKQSIISGKNLSTTILTKRLNH